MQIEETQHIKFGKNPPPTSALSASGETLSALKGVKEVTLRQSSQSF